MSFLREYAYAWITIAVIVCAIVAMLFLAGIVNEMRVHGQMEVQQSQSSTVSGQTQSVQTENGGKTIVETSHGTLKLIDDKITYCNAHDTGQNKHSICGPEYALNTDGTITK